MYELERKIDNFTHSAKCILCGAVLDSRKMYPYKGGYVCSRCVAKNPSLLRKP